MKEIKIKIETVKYGQPRAYADSRFEYILEVEGMNKWEVEQYCTKILQPNSQKKENFNSKDAGSYFRGYYELMEIGENKYNYYVFEPYTD